MLSEAMQRMRARRQRTLELQFLPAAIEILETPAPPVGRLLMAVIAALILCAVAWASIGKVDIVATATGRVVPAGQVKLLQPFETGVVKAIHVADGQHVHAGEVLIELDPTASAADGQKVRTERQQAELDVARLKALLSGNPTGFAPPADADAAAVATAREQLVAELAQQQARLNGLDGQIAVKSAEREEARAAAAKLRSTLPLVEQRAQLYEKLHENAYASKVAALEAERALIEQRYDLQLAGHRSDAAVAAIASLGQQRAETDADFRRQSLDALVKAEQLAATKHDEELKAEQRRALQTLRAPVDGTVEQMAVHTVGGVVTPAQALLVVVPDGAPLEVEALLANREAGFVHEGQTAAVKVEAFNYTRYGLLHGRVRSIGRDVMRTRPDRDTAAAGSQGTEPAGAGSAYVARLVLTETEVETEQGHVPLVAGMTVTAEISTGQRRVIEYLTSPLLRYRHESLRER